MILADALDTLWALTSAFAIWLIAAAAALTLALHALAAGLWWTCRTFWRALATLRSYLTWRTP